MYLHKDTVINNNIYTYVYKLPFSGLVIHHFCMVKKSLVGKKHKYSRLVILLTIS